MVHDPEIIPLNIAANMLGISGATLRNWIRHGYISPVGDMSPLSFHKNDICSLGRQISLGKVSRLNKRANKRQAAKRFIPKEYLKEASSAQAIYEIVSFISSAGIETELAIYVLALNLLHKKGCCTIPDGGQWYENAPAAIDKINLKNEMLDWQRSLNDIRLSESLYQLTEIFLPDEADVLGLIYQSLLNEGEKSCKGSYYTPARVVNEIAQSHSVSGKNILDPCCGTGQFLLAFFPQAEDPLCLYGTDIDHIAVRIARINLMLAYPLIEFRPNIFHIDFLLDSPDIEGGFDIILSNPPWGSRFGLDERQRLRNQFPEVSSGESFSYILLKSIKLLKAEGRLSFILPESVLYVKMHADIRSAIQQYTQVTSVEFYGRIFNGVFSKAVRLDLSKGGPSGKIKIMNAGRSWALDARLAMAEDEKNFHLHLNERDGEIIMSTFRREHLTLKGNASWALGIVTGDNQKHLRSEMKEGHEPIFRGKDVAMYNLLEPASFIEFTPGAYQQAAPEEYFRCGEKLIYRFISKRPVVAYDNKGVLTLNSANILIPRLGGYNAKCVMAILNSELLAFIYMKKFRSLKVLRGHLEQLPLPLLDKKQLFRLNQLAEKAISGSQDALCEINDRVFEIFGISSSDSEYILSENLKR